MLLATVGLFEIIVVLAYLLVVGYLGYLGYRQTKTAADYMVAGRKTHPFIMALSYGATFISTSAIVGFGGVAGLFGMSLLWLTFANIFVGIFIAFVFLGGPTRRIGHALDAHTFPELLGRRYASKFIQVFCGLVIFLVMPLYAAAVIIGGSEFITTAFDLTYDQALLIFSVIVAAYVLAGGLKGVMYTDALQGSIMFVGMIILLVWAYTSVGGVVEGHTTLSQLKDLVPPAQQAIGHNGWTAMPTCGFGQKKFELWWIVVTTIVMGVGIGVLAQPQLVVRFMTVKSKRELNRAVVIGGIFILAMTGVAFTVGALSNAYFSQHGKVFTGLAAKPLETPGHVVIHQAAKIDSDKPRMLLDPKTLAERPLTDADVGKWELLYDRDPKTGKLNLDAKTGKPKPKMMGVVASPDAPAEAQDINGEKLSLTAGRSIAIANAGGNPDQIIPAYITQAMPKWFGLVFLLTLLAAAMSTMSSQFHTIGTAAGRDIFEQLFHKGAGESTRTILVVRLGIIVGIIGAVVIGHYARGGYIVARATAIFFGMCAAAFLPAFVGGLFWKRMTRAAAIASIVTGFVVTTFWVVFVKAAEAKAIGLVQKFTNGADSILAGPNSNWPVVDPLVVALPISILVAVVVSLLTQPPSKEHLDKCFPPRPQ